MTPEQEDLAGLIQLILEHAGKGADRDALSEIPPKSRWTGVLKWIIPVLMLSAFYMGYREHQEAGLREMLIAWVLPNVTSAIN